MKNVPKVLHLNLKKEYFEDIRDGSKLFEYRLKTDFWIKRLVGRNFDEVHFKMGYPKKDDVDRIIKCKYLGYEMRDVRHKHFNNTGATDPQVTVFAIFANGERL